VLLTPALLPLPGAPLDVRGPYSIFLCRGLLFYRSRGLLVCLPLPGSVISDGITAFPLSKSFDEKLSPFPRDPSVFKSNTPVTATSSYNLRGQPTFCWCGCTWDTTRSGAPFFLESYVYFPALLPPRFNFISVCFFHSPNRLKSAFCSRSSVDHPFAACIFVLFPTHRIVPCREFHFPLKSPLFAIVDSTTDRRSLFF